MNRKPDFSRMRKVLLRQGEPDYLPFCDLYIDDEIIESITGKGLIQLDLTQIEQKKKYLEILTGFFCGYGYDYISLRSSLEFQRTNVIKSTDTAGLPREKKRDWVNEHHGMIESQIDFENYRWMKKNEVGYFDIEYVSKIMPEGMKIIARSPGGILENLMFLMSYETLCYKLYEESELIEGILDKIGTLMCYDFETLADYEGVGALAIADDMGFKTQTMISPKDLRKYILPWHKKMAEIGHKHNLPVLLHSCGNLEEVMDDIIDEVKIDAKHSYEDVIMPVTEAKKKYGDRVAIIGGVDVNVLAGKTEPEVRKYVRNIIQTCVPGGGYALGSGNSIANYIPVENYLAMLDEGSKYCY